MSQLNLKKILSSDELSKLVDIVNYNFDQIVLNGGGPKGLQGIIGSPGLPGLQGDHGETGPTGIDGTYLYSAAVGPTSYPFGTGGESLPRSHDVYMEVEPNQIMVYEYDGSLWKLVGTVTAPGGATTLLYDNDYLSGPTSSKISLGNDITQSEKVFFGNKTSYLTGSTGIGLIDPLQPGFFIPEYTALDALPTVGVTPLLSVSSDRNQLRLLCTSVLNVDLTNEGGGILHSVDTISGIQAYKITNGDLLGNKRFLVSMNYWGLPTENLLVGSTANDLCVGGALTDTLKAKLSVKNSLAVGSYIFYSGASFSSNKGIVSEGNLSIGRTGNSLATGGFFTSTGTTANVLIDTNYSNLTPNAVSRLDLGINIGSGSSTRNGKWSFIHTGYLSSTLFKNFTLRASQNYSDGAYLNGGFTDYNVLNAKFAYISTVSPSATSYSNFKPQVGIDNTDGVATFEVGNGFHRVSLGQPGYDSPNYMASYIGMNLSRNPSTGLWTRRSDTASNGGVGFWANSFGDLNLSVFGTTGESYVTNLTDTNVAAKTKFSFKRSGSLVLSETRNASGIGVDGLRVDFGATGVSGESWWRRGIAIFGDSPDDGDMGSPMICDTNGLTQSSIILPQYTFYNNDRLGMYLSEGNRANGDSGESVGFCVDQEATITTTSGAKRIGLYTRTPHERVQIGEQLVFHDGDSKFFGFNTYYGLTGSPTPVWGLYPLKTESTALGTAEGAALLSVTSTGKPNTLGDYKGFMQFGGVHSLQVFPAVSSMTTPFLNSDTATKTQIKITTGGFPGVFTGGVRIYYNLNKAPKMLVGFNEDYETVTSGDVHVPRRGTVSIVSQFLAHRRSGIMTPNPYVFTDDYTLGLYDYLANPVAGIRATNFTQKTSALGPAPPFKRQFEIKILSDRASNETLTTDNDVSAILVKTNLPDASDVISNGDRSRQVQIGDGFRMGIGKPLTETLAGSATLEVGTTGGAERAANFVGDVYVTGTASISKDIEFTGTNATDQTVYADKLKVMTTPTDVSSFYNDPGSDHMAVTSISRTIWSKVYDRFVNIRMMFAGGTPLISIKLGGPSGLLVYWKITSDSNSTAHITVPVPAGQTLFIEVGGSGNIYFTVTEIGLGRY